MLAIMKSIYDMMGRYTYPCVRDEAPYEHVDKFFQVISAKKGNKKQASVLFWVFFLIVVFNFFQKMDKNRDGVVTIEEFIETCQKVCVFTTCHQRDLQILHSCHMFYHML